MHARARPAPPFNGAPHTLQRIHRKPCGRAGRCTFCSPTASSAAAARSACSFFGALCPRAHVPREHHRSAARRRGHGTAAYTAPCPVRVARRMFAFRPSSCVRLSSATSRLLQRPPARVWGAAGFFTRVVPTPSVRAAALKAMLHSAAQSALRRVRLKPTAAERNAAVPMATGGAAGRKP
jgi:hypothetical protein